MSVEATVEAPANIAFIKYWGAADLERAIPLNPSISMTLRRCVSRTTVRLIDEGRADEVFLVGEAGDLQPCTGSFRSRVVAQLERLRLWSGTRNGFCVATRNSFPAAAGMASSASGFAALTVAVVHALGKPTSAAELSELARLSGSGSASRSVMGGYVEWPTEADPDSCRATQLAPESHWDLRDVVALVQRDPKTVSSLEGHVRAPTSPHFARRQELLSARLDVVREAIRERCLERLGPVLELDAIELHLVAMSSVPAIFYWSPATLRVLERVRRLRQDGLEAWSTMDAGANVHVICTPQSEPQVAAALAATEGVHELVRDGVGAGPKLLTESLLPAAP